ncbi:MAG: glycosyltransferase [Prevotella sp.]|nr:glycosyltransferase [Prevotella sp.]
MAQVQTISHFKVSVWCNTYNQASYIKDTMDGFCMQQTSFPFVCLIMDDASTDGEPEVIKQYLNDHFDTEWTKETDDYHLTLARHQENTHCYFAVYLLKYNHYSIKKPRLKYYREVTDEIDYVALCEGDDYWTDAHKLQKQADALDANPQATLVYTNFQAIDGEGNPISRPFIKDYPGRSHSGDNLPTLLRYGNYIMVLTSMYRYKVWQSKSFANCPIKMDFALTLSAAMMGDFIWLPEQTGCYRILESGMIQTGRRKGDDWGEDIYRYYAGLVMNGQCKPLSLGRRVHLTTLILKMALLKKDIQLKNDTQKSNWLSYLLLPVAYVRLKCERLKIRINKIIK